MRTAQSKLPVSPGDPSSRPRQQHSLRLRSAGTSRRLGAVRISRWSSRKRGQTTLSGGGLSSCPPVLLGGLQESLAERAPGDRQDRSISAHPPCGRNFGPRTYREHGCEGACVSECACVRVRECARPCARAHRAVGACACRERRSPAAWNLESFPLSRSCGSDTPPRPTGGDDVCSLVASQSPGCRCRSLTGAGAQTSAAGPLAKRLRQRRLPPPHLPARPGGGVGGDGRNQSL